MAQIATGCKHGSSWPERVGTFLVAFYLGINNCVNLDLGMVWSGALSYKEFARCSDWFNQIGSWSFDGGSGPYIQNSWRAPSRLGPTFATRSSWRRVCTVWYYILEVLQRVRLAKCTALDRKIYAYVWNTTNSTYLQAQAYNYHPPPMFYFLTIDWLIKVVYGNMARTKSFVSLKMLEASRICPIFNE